MHPDLDRLIRLQAIETELHKLRKTVESEPERRLAAEARVEGYRASVAQARERLTENQTARRVFEKDLAQMQGRLSKYRDQLMQVKTNKEYQAMQTEIATAEGEVRKFEDCIIESMVEADGLAADVKRAEGELTEAEKEAKVTFAALAAETTAAQVRLTSASATRSELAAAMPHNVLRMFEQIASHRGAAVVEARDGHCTVCHVRLRPKLYQDLRRNDAIWQCDSCQRILYFVPPAPAAQPAAAAN